jgi:hypothetical protein
MAISRRPSVKTETTSDVNIDALIAKGGSVPQEVIKEEPKAQKADVAFTLRIPSDICEKLDHLRKVPYKTSRQQWVIEAIVQRLSKEEKGNE